MYPESVIINPRSVLISHNVNIFLTTSSNSGRPRPLDKLASEFHFDLTVSEIVF